MRQAQVFYKDFLAGTISEDENGYTFVYDENFLLQENVKPISLTLPLRQEPYFSKILFPFFDGLILKDGF
ncbi:phosphatidylinositol kinase (plasmid) [Bergeyella porcorum]|uniref:Phosphatidylinositol kinase n=1 Tax=Bergeyella porcorum TaxID=1735111 RepID=A0AAU0F348_9FLAO